MIGPTNGGIGCCGSPTARLIGGLPGGVSPMSSRARTKGDRPLGARTDAAPVAAPIDMEADSRVILYITNSGTARRITGAIA